jgi:hypothetical protein
MSRGSMTDTVAGSPSGADFPQSPHFPKRKPPLCARKMGREGGYIFSPSHAVEGDVSMENIMAFIELAKSQTGV